MLAKLLLRLADRSPAPLAATLRRLAGSDAVVLIRGFLLAASVWAFLLIANAVREGGTHEFDALIMRSVRDAQDPRQLAGPLWLESVVRDYTALGSAAVLVLFTLAVAVFLAVRRQFHAMTLVVVATLGGILISSGLKMVFERPRPDVVPHLAHVSSHSFPSGHSMSSAVVYLTLGALLSQLVQERKLKAYFLGVACFLTFLVGASRVLLGVHYPTDVVAGWAAGLAWSVMCWMAASYLQRRGTVEKAK